MKLKYDGLLSHFAFKFNLRRFTKAARRTAQLAKLGAMADQMPTVGRCRLTASKPELKGRLVSAISA